MEAKRERAEGEKGLTQMLLLEPSTPTQHNSIPSNHLRSLSCQLHVSKSSPKINLTIRAGRARVLVLLLFRIFFFPESSNEEFSNTCNGTPAVFEEL